MRTALRSARRIGTGHGGERRNETRCALAANDPSQSWGQSLMLPKSGHPSAFRQLRLGVEKGPRAHELRRLEDGLPSLCHPCLDQTPSEPFVEPVLEGHGAEIRGIETKRMGLVGCRSHKVCANPV